MERSLKVQNRDGLEALLTVMEGVAKKNLMYVRASSFLSRLGFVLFVAAVACILSHGAYW
jgi:hypothetical protein